MWDLVNIAISFRNKKIHLIIVDLQFKKKTVKCLEKIIASYEINSNYIREIALNKCITELIYLFVFSLLCAGGFTTKLNIVHDILWPYRPAPFK